MPRIFINYRRQDSEGYVGRLYDHLTRAFDPDEIFMDVEGIQPGADFHQALEDAVSACDVFLAVIGPQWLGSADEQGQRRLDQPGDLVRAEVAAALKHGKLIIPVLVGGAQMPTRPGLPEEIGPLAVRNAVTLTHQRFGADAAGLVEAVREAFPAPAVPTADPEAVRQKREAIKAIRDDLVSAVDSPLYAHRTENGYFPVVGDGHPDARILFIGEAPGKFEAAEGRPFTGPSGEVLNEMLGDIGLRREDVFVTNIVLDHPPGNRTPTAEEITFYAPFVDRLIDAIRPAVIVTLGGAAMTHVLKKLNLPEQRSKIGALHGKLIKAVMPYGEIHVVPLYHPAVVLYSASQKTTLRKDFQKLKLFT